MSTKGRSGQTDKTMWKTEQKVKTYVEKFHMIEPGDTIVLGISGGADSVCLLKILSRWKESWGISLEAVHVHHQLRGKEADDDATFVRRLCEEEGISCQVFHEDVQGIANREKTGLGGGGRLEDLQGTGALQKSVKRPAEEKLPLLIIRMILRKLCFITW